MQWHNAVDSQSIGERLVPRLVPRLKSASTVGRVSVCDPRAGWRCTERARDLPSGMGVLFRMPMSMQTVTSSGGPSAAAKARIIAAGANAVSAMAKIDYEGARDRVGKRAKGQGQEGHSPRIIAVYKGTVCKCTRVRCAGVQVCRCAGLLSEPGVKMSTPIVRVRRQEISTFPIRKVRRFEIDESSMTQQIYFTKIKGVDTA